jgi:hypothetical protein
VQRAHDRLAVEAVADAELFHFLDQLGGKLVGDLVRQVEPLDRQAGLAAVEKPADRGGADRAVETASSRRSSIAPPSSASRLKSAAADCIRARVGGAGKPIFLTGLTATPR